MIRYQVIPLIRLSEMYLIVMETAELTEANKLYKSYMAEKNALITTDMAREELNAEILNEYRREFWGEGQMFYAYKRLGVKEMMWKTDREVEEKDYIVPLPTTESGIKLIGIDYEKCSFIFEYIVLCNIYVGM